MTHEIIETDSLEWLMDFKGTVDAFIMDPPYASGARSEANKKASGSMVRGEKWASRPIENDQMTTVGFVWFMRAVLRECRRTLKEGGSILCFTDWRQWPNLCGVFESVDFRINQMVVWDKQSMGLGNGFRAQHELVLHASVGTPEIYHKGASNVISCKRSKRTDHPSPKPVQLIQALIEVVTKPGDLIIDPFCGSGTTIEAAKNSGRNAVGLEILPEHVDTARSHISQGALFAL